MRTVFEVIDSPVRITTKQGKREYGDTGADENEVFIENLLTCQRHRTNRVAEI